MAAQQGDRVRVHYTLKDVQGKVVESSRDSIPIEFVIGEGKVIRGFERNIVGMKAGSSTTVTIPPEEGYGHRDEGRVFEFSRKNAPGNFDPQIGQTVQMHRPDGKSVVVTVLSRTEKGYMMDANHPLAGKELIFDLELIEIVK
ncbi:MAG: peptidylprolyl isomerase [Nitrospiraceae bacterium]|nr:MAG: peptidylprolyl isomerase [Nitrospiraceae bacterium]